MTNIFEGPTCATSVHPVKRFTIIATTLLLALGSVAIANPAFAQKHIPGPEELPYDPPKPKTTPGPEELPYDPPPWCTYSGAEPFEYTPYRPIGPRDECDEAPKPARLPGWGDPPEWSEY
jgi:hypothetical protein